MTADPTIDIDELVRPLPGDDPGGVPLPFDVRNNLDAWRNEPDPDFHDPAAPPPPPAEWGKVIATASDFLTATGKDLTAAVRLVEALTKKHATAGLRDGLTLLVRLAENGWEHVHPHCDPDDQEARSNRLNWLNDGDKGGKFPQTVLRMPVVKTARGEGYSAADWLDPGRKAEIEADAGSIPADGVRAAAADLAGVRDALRRLGMALDARMGKEAPDLSNDAPGGLGPAVLQCEDFVRGVARAKGVPLDAAAEGDSPADASIAATAAAPAAAGGREQLYRQLAGIADALKRIEPHSPIPYLLERCVRLGAMPFPDLMREVIRESGALDDLDRLLGLSRPG